MADVVFPAPGAAYRADAHGRADPFGPHDDEWLAAATELHLAATGGANRQDHLFSAIGMALDLLGDERIEAYAAREWSGQRSYIDPLVLLAETVYYGGARHLAALMFDEIRRTATDLSPLQVGRIMARRARIAWSLGAGDDATERYQAIVALGRKTGSFELLATGELGLVTMAQFRGDFPDLRARTPRAARLAERTGNTAVVRWSLLATMMSDASQGKFDQAVAAGWRLFELSRGYPVWEAEAFINMGQLLLEAGHPDDARASFSAAVEREAPARLLLLALGGLAIASALVGHEPTVEWTVREVWRAQEHSMQPYAVASAHLECAVALHTLARDADAERHRAAAEELGRRYGFHEVAFKADALRESRRKPRVELAPDAARITGQLVGMAPDQLPAALAFDVAPV